MSQSAAEAERTSRGGAEQMIVNAIRPKVRVRSGFQTSVDGGAI
jgi:hypothetical protein